MYNDMTLFFSEDYVTMIAHVIPTMDWINTMLSSSSTEPFPPSVKHALSFMWEIMDKYIVLENRLVKCLLDCYGSVVNGVSVLFHTDYCLVLHPQLKLKYFQ